MVMEARDYQCRVSTNGEIGHAGQVLRAGENHGGLILFRRTVRSTAYGEQACLLTEFWFNDGRAWDSMNRIVYLRKSP